MTQRSIIAAMSRARLIKTTPASDNSLHNIGDRLKGLAGGADCHSAVPLHPNYRAMAVANGVSPADPILAKCRADNDAISRGTAPR